MTQKHSYLLKDSIILFLTFGLAFLPFLGSHALFVPDEGRYPNAAREMLIFHHWLVPTINGIPFLDKPILYYWLEAVAMKLLGVNLYAIRISPALFGILGCWFTYFVGQSLFNRRVGWLAAIILGASLLYFGCAHYADMDLEVAVLLSATLFCFLLARRNHQQKKSVAVWMYLAYFFAGLAFLTKGLMGIVFPIYIIGVWILISNRWSVIKWMRIPTGLLLFLLITLPWVIAIQFKQPWFFHYFFIFQQFDRYTGTGFNNRQPFWFYIPIIVVGMLPWSILGMGGVKSAIMNFWKKRDSDAAFLGLWVFLIVLFFSVPQSKLVGYILPVCPPLALLLANYFDDIYCEKSALIKPFQITNIVACVLYCCLGVVSIVLPHFVRAIAQLKLPFSCLGIVFLLAGIINLIFFHSKPISKIFQFWVASTIAVFITVLWVCVYIPVLKKSIALLVQAAKPYIKHNTDVVVYGVYYYDLPVYLNLNHPLIVVNNWHDQGTLNEDAWRGINYTSLKDYPWMIDFDAFHKLWQSHKSVVVFTTKQYFNALRNEVSPKPLLLTTFQNDVVLLKPLNCTSSSCDESISAKSFEIK